jgi:hypothetical protein
MAEKQALNATFFAFRKREKGGVLLGASVGFILGCILLVILFFGAAIGAAALGFATFPTGDPEALATQAPGQIIGAMALVYLLMFIFYFFYFVLLAAYEAACLRWMIKGERRGFLGLSLGPDTWRVYGSYWLWFLFALVGYIVSALVLALMSAVLIGFLGANSWIGMALLGLVYIAAVVYLLVRFAPAAAASVGAGQFAFFSAWPVTRGRFWAMFGSLLLLAIMNAIIWVGLNAAVLLTVFPQFLSADYWANAGQDPTAASQAYTDSVLAALSGPTSLAIIVAFLVFSLAITMTMQVVGYGINARAVIAAAEDGKIKGLVPANVADTFN